MEDLPQCELDDTTLGAYVHSPYAALEELFAHEGLKSNHVLLDLGCGDGRACLLAAEKFGAIGVGVDIDGDLVEKFVAKAAAKGLRSRTVGIAADACQSPQLLFGVDKLPHLLPLAPEFIVPMSSSVSPIQQDASAATTTAAPQPSLLRITHIYLFILQHRLHLLVPTLRDYLAVYPGLVIMSAFAMPDEYVPDRTFTDSSGMFHFRTYTKL